MLCAVFHKSVYSCNAKIAPIVTAGVGTRRRPQSHKKAPLRNLGEAESENAKPMLLRAKAWRQALTPNAALVPDNLLEGNISATLPPEIHGQSRCRGSPINELEAHLRFNRQSGRVACAWLIHFDTTAKQACR